MARGARGGTFSSGRRPPHDDSRVIPNQDPRSTTSPEQYERGTVATGKDVAVKRFIPMKRPGYGTVGRKIMVQTNFFRFSAPKLDWIHQYCLFVDAMRRPEPARRQKHQYQNRGHSQEQARKELTEITPTAQISFLRNVLKAWWGKHCPNTVYAHDGRKTIYTRSEIPINLESRDSSETCGDRQFALEVDSEGNVTCNPVGVTDDRSVSVGFVETVYVRIRKVSLIDCRKIIADESVDTHEASSVISAIDCILARGPNQTHVQVGRSFFHHSGAQSLRGGVEAWRGFYQSARRTESGLLINMDESRTPFWAGGGHPLARLLDDMRLNVHNGDERENKFAARLLNGLKVRNKHNKITYRIYGFSRKSAFEETFFDQQKNAQVSVASYMERKYGITLRDHRAVCVRTHPKKNTLIPLELLDVVANQRMTKSMSAEQTSNMIKAASTRPHIRAQGAVDAIRKVNHNGDSVCREFGMRVEQEPFKVSAHVLAPPIMQYNQSRDEPRCGVWNNRHEKKLLKCTPVFTWCVLNLTPARENEIYGFMDRLVQNAKRMGMDMTPDPKIFNFREFQLDNAFDSIYNYYQNQANITHGWPLQLILCIKGKQDTVVYNAIKRITDIELGVASQVMLAKHLRPRQQTYFGNLLLKINAKLGGSNFVPVTSQAPDVPFAKLRHIVLGADVTHHTGGGNKPSVAALVGSRDPQCTQFTGSLRNMPPRQELMTDIGDMFREVYDRWLNYWPADNRQHASSIIMFRDGVSEGQFEQVMEFELEGIRRACTRYNPMWNPKITYIIVTKRHHARFFPLDKRDQDRSGNCLPGTVIDTDITSTEYYDFYLNSHVGIQGTSRPSKYTVLVDENNIPVDALQAYVYRLAHSYARCNRSVSIVSSAYYAHLLAFRGRAYLNEEGSETGSISSGDNTTPMRVNLHSKLGKRLYFV